VSDVPSSLRIAFLLPSFPELSNTFILNQITGLLDRGHDVRLIAVAKGSFDGAAEAVVRYRLSERMCHVPIPRGRGARVRSALALLASPSGRTRAALDGLDPRHHGKAAWNLVAYHTAVSILRAAGFDVLHCQFGTQGPAAERVLRLARLDVPLVTSFRGADLTRTLQRQPRRFDHLLRNGDLFLPVSDGFRQRLIAAGAPPERVVVHRSGIDLRRFPFSPRPPDEAVPRLLFVGRLTEKKGVEYLLEALGLLVASGREVELSVIGDGPLKGALEEQGRGLGLAHHVRFEGARPHDEVVAALRRSHALVAPSVTAADGDQEGIPNVLKEAMACGLPVVGTHHSGIPELIEDGVNGFLAPERDGAALAEQIARLLDDPARWPSLGAAARRRIAQEYDTERLNDELVRFYRRAIAARSARVVGQSRSNR
jgi:colanic acid/amylovoran biosynthesis glycosyltransferase